MNGSDYDKEIFDLYSPYMNKFWLFLVNSSEVANSLLEKDNYEKDELYINGIIIPESLNYTMPEKNNNSVTCHLRLDTPLPELSEYTESSRGAYHKTN